jgi:hypothetical protein
MGLFFASLGKKLLSLSLFLSNFFSPLRFVGNVACLTADSNLEIQDTRPIGHKRGTGGPDAEHEIVHLLSFWFNFFVYFLTCYSFEQNMSKKKHDMKKREREWESRQNEERVKIMIFMSTYPDRRSRKSGRKRGVERASEACL